MMDPMYQGQVCRELKTDKGEDFNFSPKERIYLSYPSLSKLSLSSSVSPSPTSALDGAKLLRKHLSFPKQFLSESEQMSKCGLKFMFKFKDAPMCPTNSV